MSVKIEKIEQNSIAAEIGLEPGDILVSINGKEINDVLDYDFYKSEEEIVLEIKPKLQLQPEFIDIEKDQDEDLGLTFSTYLMDEHHSCTNKCVFCFVDQMPKGLRDSLYFKDDDERLSFLFGNYITMTNMKQEEVDRIITMRISPINISVHTTDPEIRKKMMGNRFAGKTLDYLRQLNEAKIQINAQIVLCPELNDGIHLEKTIRDLLAMNHSVQSIAVVPVGLTKFREDLYTLKAFDLDSARETIQAIQAIGEETLKERGKRVVFPADELYLTAKWDLPSAEFYEDFYQLANGVGMLRLLEQEFMEALAQVKEAPKEHGVTLVTGEAAVGLISQLVARAVEQFPQIRAEVFAIQNEFFGGNVTVAGLVTGTDILNQLQHKKLENTMILPSVMLKYGETSFLDGMEVCQLEEKLKVKIQVSQTSGESLLQAIFGG